MTIARLADLRETPLIGRRYMVPAVRAWWMGKVADWPVLGPAHTDREFFSFPHRHYHVDARFLSRAMLRGTNAWVSDDPVDMTQRYPLSGANEWRPDGTYAPPEDAIPTGRPSELPYRCVRVDLPYGYGHTHAVTSLRAKFGAKPCAPIELADGRRLCPHRKVDLSSMAPDADGVVTCPLHGLRVQMTEARP